MNPMQSKSPEERRAIAAKAHETARKNREEKARRRAEAEAKVLDLTEEIAALKRKRDAIAGEIEASDISARLTGHTLLTESAIVGAAKPADGFCGVYFLISRGRVVYVGQSVNVFSRVAQHSADKDFDAMAWVPCERRMLDKLESLYIHTLSPELNGDGGPGGTKTAPLRLDDLLGAGAA